MRTKTNYVVRNVYSSEGYVDRNLHERAHGLGTLAYIRFGVWNVPLERVWATSLPDRSVSDLGSEGACRLAEVF